MARQGDPSQAAPTASLDVPIAGAAPIRVHVFPATRGFVQDVRAAVIELCAPGTPLPRPETLEQRLRAWYPSVTVHLRRDVAGFGDQDELWYVFRDGAIRRRPEVVDRMYSVLQAARHTSAASRSVLERSAEVMDRAAQLTKPAKGSREGDRASGRDRGGTPA